MNFLSSPLNRTLLLAALAILIGLFGYIMLVQPALNNFNQSSLRLQTDQQQYSDLKRVADQKPVYLALTRRIQSRLKNVEQTADARAYIPSYLKQIENLAKQDGLQVTSVTPQATPSPSPAPSGAPASPNPQSLNVGPIQSATKAAGSEALQTQATNNVATATGATPIPGAPPPPGVSRSGGAGPLQSAATTSARANAIAYLNTSFALVPINLELSGTYSQLQTFLRHLNTFPKLIGVGNLTMTPGARHAVGETPTLSITLPIIAYRLSPGGAGALPPSPLASPNPSGVGRNGG